MSRLHSWYEHCAELWKGRKRVDLSDLAGRMDADLGAWPSEMGSRAEAASHAQRLGVSNRTVGALKDAVPGTDEHKVHQFFKDAASYARRKTVRNPVVMGGDTLTGEIDKPHLEHFTAMFADHHSALDFVPNKAGGASWTLNGGAMRVRTMGVRRRNQAMHTAGHSPVHTMDDLDTLHTGVEHAIKAGKVDVAHANRYHVMRGALRRVAATWADQYPNDKFMPSWGAMDTTALRVMRTGADHLDATGFGEAKARLQPVLDAAIAAHEAHPLRQRTDRKGAKDVSAHDYPGLHKIGSDSYWKQMSQVAGDSRRRDSRRGAATSEIDAASHVPAAIKAPAKPAPAAEAPAFKEPSSYDEYKQRVEAGEKFEPGLTMKMERQRMLERRTRKSFAAHTFYKAWLDWRGESTNG